MTDGIDKKISMISVADQIAFYEDFRFKKPVVLYGALVDWSGTLFDFNRLEEGFGHERVFAYVLPRDVSVSRMSSVKSEFHCWSDEDVDHHHIKGWTFREFITELRQGVPHYLMANDTKNVQLRDLLAAEAGRFDYAPMYDVDTSDVRREFFFGSKNAGPGLHHDGAIESFICQLIGVKKFRIFSPSEIPNLYPADSWLAPTGHFSAVADSFNPDMNNFPKFCAAQAHFCRLKPGDVLYMPPYWYHDACPMEPSVSMTFRSPPPADRWGTRQDREALEKAAMALYRCLAQFPSSARGTFVSLLSNDLNRANRDPEADK